MHPAARALRQLTLKSGVSPREAASDATAETATGGSAHFTFNPARSGGGGGSGGEDGSNSSGYEDEEDFSELYSDAVSGTADSGVASTSTLRSSGGAYSRSDVEDMVKDMKRHFEERLREKERSWEEQEREQATLLAASSDEADRLRDKCAGLQSVVGEYERSMAELISERDYGGDGAGGTGGNAESEAHRRVRLERDQLLVDLRGVEASFSDLHRRYEKVRESVDDYRRNEEQLKNTVGDYRAALERADQRYQQLHRSCEERLSAANQALDAARRAADADVARLQAAVRKSELRIQSLETQLQQKNQECTELTAICDELIAKIGSGGR